ncbi:hypothetical protein HBZS_116460 [Helicobacter bizzozeronii CCUG 35545]|nr:hypothetical protein HBZS_116460 [Helicobacter bizzozeronii CCUG 35545]
MRVYLHFVPSSKPKEVFMILKQVPLHSTSFCIISKSNKCLCGIPKVF